MESILITGASGFIGSFIVEEALKRKFGVWAVDLGSRKREYLTIYRDIVKKNLTLTKQLRVLNAAKTMKEVSSKATKVDRVTSNATVATDALGRWLHSLAVNGFHKKN